MAVYLTEDEQFSHMGFEPTPEPDTKQLIPLIVGSCLTVCIILFNVLLAASLLIGKNYNTFTLCVFHLVALDLAIGACVSPLQVSYEYNTSWLYGNVVCNFWITLDTFVTSLIVTTCMVINLERILDSRHSTYRLWRELWTWKHFLFIWAPWISAIIIGIPIFYKGTINIHDNINNYNQCYNNWQQPYQLIFLSLMYFVPALLAIITLLIAVVCSVCPKRYPEGAIPPLNGSSTAALILVNVITVLMILPLNILLILEELNVYHFSALLHTILYWISLASSALRPIIWLFDPEIRSGYGLWYRKCCKRQHSVETNNHGS